MLSALELCADAIVSAASLRSILVSGGGAALVVNIFFKDSRKNFKISFSPQNFLVTFLVIDPKLNENKYTAKMPSTARQQIVGGCVG